MLTEILFYAYCMNIIIGWLLSWFIYTCRHSIYETWNKKAVVDILLCFLCSIFPLGFIVPVVLMFGELRKGDTH